MRKRKLRGAVVVITGASSGIGQATARAFARRGAKLVLAARNEVALQVVAEECEERGAEALVVATDVTDAMAVKRLAEAADERFGRIDVWINNAGVGAVGKFEETPIEAHEQVIRTNLLGSLHGTHAVLPYFQRQGRGIVINTNSLGGFVPAPYAVAYTASKFGLRGFSEALRAELTPWPGIRICDVYPAFIDTPGLRHAANFVGREIKPLPPVYDAATVARAIVSLADRPRNSAVAGQATNVARLAYQLFPGAVRTGMARLMRRYFSVAKRVKSGEGNLFQSPSDEPQIDGAWKRPSPWGAIAAGVGVGLLVGATACIASGKR